MAFPIANYPAFKNLMPPQAFEAIIANGGQSVLWMKSHSCPCNGNTGSPLPTCSACLGRGTYWDPVQGPFIVLNTLVTWIGRNVDMGDNMDPSFGMAIQGHPIITIPKTQEPLWTQANNKDVFIQVDTMMRFQATLRVGENETVPAWHVLDTVTIAASGAVVVEDPTIQQPVSSIIYTVSGGTVTLNSSTVYPSGYPKGTSYTVEYYSPLAWVLEEPFGGLPHVRPFGAGSNMGVGLNYPKRFKASVLDLWLRDNLGSSTSIQPATAQDIDTTTPQIDTVTPDVDTGF